jgi:hypothetical protein
MFDGLLCWFGFHKWLTVHSDRIPGNHRYRECIECDKLQVLLQQDTKWIDLDE